MIHANIAYRLPIPTELDKIGYLINANIEDRRFCIYSLSPEAQKELRTLGYKIVRRETINQYEISW